jgi:hypothetical protein
LNLLKHIVNVIELSPIAKADLLEGAKKALADQ